MTERAMQFRLGLAAVIASAGLYFIGIPYWVSAPANVPNIVLSPLFWPQVLTALTGLSGLGLLAFASRGNPEPVESDVPDRRSAYLRLAAMGLVMVGIMYGLPRLGMVWTCALGFVATAFVVRAGRLGIVLAAAVLVPLALYFFFAHVAGVAIPQGNFVSLP